MSKAEDSLLQQLNDVNALNRDLVAELKRISELSMKALTIVAIEGERAALSNGTYIPNNKYAVGDLCLVHPQTGGVVDKVNHPFLGSLQVIDEVKDNYVTITIKGESRICYWGKHSYVKAGDIVLLDPSDTVITFVVEEAKPAKASINKITWDDIGGHEEAKLLLREAVELPYKHPKLYGHYKKSPPNGIMLYGPPGCGKTLLGKATAHAVDSHEGFFVVKGPELLNEYVGTTERSIRTLFTKARLYKEKHGRPAVLFIDEAEALLSNRTRNHNYMGQTVVPTFLAEMDGLDTKSTILILSTNRPDMLDEAIIRDGRVDHKIEIKRPDSKQAVEIFNIHIDGKPIMKGHHRNGLIEFAISTLYQHDKLPFSGALIAGCVDKATTHALRRDVINGQVTGLCTDDFARATDEIIKQEVISA